MSDARESRRLVGGGNDIGGGKVGMNNRVDTSARDCNHRQKRCETEYGKQLLDSTYQDDSRKTTAYRYTGCLSVLLMKVDKQDQNRCGK